MSKRLPVVSDEVASGDFLTCLENDHKRHKDSEKELSTDGRLTLSTQKDY